MLRLSMAKKRLSWLEERKKKRPVKFKGKVTVFCTPRLRGSGSYKYNETGLLKKHCSSGAGPGNNSGAP